MLHKCVKCGKVYNGKDSALMFGCDCGTRLFMLIHEEDESAISSSECQKIGEKLGGAKFGELSKDRPIVLRVERAKGNEHRPLEDEVENVKVFERGCYEINVESLMRGNPIVIKTDKEVYYVQMPKINKHK